MKNCYIKTFKKEIADANLPKYGEIHFKVNNSSNNILGVRVKVPEAVKETVVPRIVGNCHFTDSTGAQNYGKTLENTDRTKNMYLSAGSCDVYIGCRYGFDDFSVIQNTERLELDFNELIWSSVNCYCTLATNSLQGAIITGDISDCVTDFVNLSIVNCNRLTGSLDNVVKSSTFFKDNNQGSIMFGGTNLSMNLSSLEGKTHLKTFSPNAKVLGDIKYLGYTAETNIRFIPAAAPNITGSVEEFVSIAISSGRTTGSVTFNNANTKAFTSVKYQNTPLSENVNVPDKVGAVMSWDAQGNISWS